MARPKRRNPRWRSEPKSPRAFWFAVVILAVQAGWLATVGSSLAMRWSGWEAMKAAAESASPGDGRAPAGIVGSPSAGGAP